MNQTKKGIFCFTIILLTLSGCSMPWQMDQAKNKVNRGVASVNLENSHGGNSNNGGASHGTNRGERPGENLDWGIETPPRQQDIHWEIINGTAISRFGAGSFPLAQEGMGGLYRRARAMGVNRPIIFGIHGHGGKAWIGGKWGVGGIDDLTYQGEEVSVTFLGLSADARMEVSFHSSSTATDPTGEVRIFNLGLIGNPSDAFAIRANGSPHRVAKKVLLDHFWFIHGNPAAAAAGNLYDAGIHIDNVEKLVIRHHQYRGLRMRRHLFYIKRVIDFAIIENNDCRETNQTCTQIRPDSANQSLPTGRVMLRGNYCQNCSATFSEPDGGAVLTVYVSSSGLYIYDNSIENPRYSALTVTGQSSAINFSFLPSGNQHREVYLSGNTFRTGPNSDRDIASISSADNVVIFGDNVFVGNGGTNKFILDSEWNHQQNGTRNLLEEFVRGDSQSGLNLLNTNIIFRGGSPVPLDPEEIRLKTTWVLN